MAGINAARYQPHPAYKPSGVEWLGDIPKGWEMWKIAHAFDRIGSGTTPPSDNQKWYDGDIPWVTTGELREGIVSKTAKSVSKKTIAAYPTLRLHPTGSIVIAMYGATIGRLGILGVDATTNQACCVIPKSNQIANQYLYYWLQAFKNEIISLSVGGGQPNINQEIVRSLKVSCPTFTEQTKIAAFLDHETVKIDTLIAKQQRLIALLEEKRQAVISHAVTKGLDPTAPLRPSGIDWLGEVPAHWRILKGNLLGSLFGSEVLAESNIKPVGEIPYIKVSSLLPIGFDLGNVEFFLAAARQNSVTTHQDFIVFPKRGAAIFTNKVNIVRIPALLDPNLMGWKCNDFMDLEFLAHVLKMKNLKEIADVSTVPQINNKHIHSLQFPVPPLTEQKEIATILAKRGSDFDRLDARAQSAITLLKERRTALISAAVTGKIDLREWQAPDATSDISTQDIDQNEEALA